MLPVIRAIRARRRDFVVVFLVVFVVVVIVVFFVVAVVVVLIAVVVGAVVFVVVVIAIVVSGRVEAAAVVGDEKYLLRAWRCFFGSNFTPFSLRGVGGIVVDFVFLEDVTDVHDLSVDESGRPVHVDVYQETKGATTKGRGVRSTPSSAVNDTHVDLA